MQNFRIRITLPLLLVLLASLFTSLTIATTTIPPVQTPEPASTKASSIPQKHESHPPVLPDPPLPNSQPMSSLERSIEHGDYVEDVGHFIGDFFHSSRAQLVLDLDVFRELWQEVTRLRESALEGDADHVQAVIDFLGPLVEHSPEVSAQCLADLFHFFWTTYNYALTAKRGAACGDCNCTADYRRQLRDYEWIFDVVDSIGKVPAAIVGGNILWTGSWHTCRKVTAVKNAQGQLWRGQYCMARFYPYNRHNPLKAFAAKEEDPTEVCNSNQSSLFEEWSAEDRTCFSMMPLLNWGLCTPDSCTAYDTQKIIEFVYTAVELVTDGKFVCHVDVQCNNSRPENALWNDNKSLAIGGVLLCTLALIIFGTCYELCVVKPFDRGEVMAKPFRETSESRTARETPNLPTNSNADHEIEVLPYPADGNEMQQEPCLPSTSKENSSGMSQKSSAQMTVHLPHGPFPTFIMWFSLARNLGYIMDTKSEVGGQQIRCLHGLRFLAMAWVIFGHTYYYICTSFTTDNLLKTLQLFPRYFYNQLVVQAPLAVDAFFFLSGLLTAYIFLGKLARNQVRLTAWSTWFAYFVRRYLRLTPVYVVIMLLEVTLFTYVSEGPFWRPIEPTHCRNSWWTNLLYINNFVKQDDPCMGWTWYLANDFQLYAFAPLLIIALHKFKRMGVLLAIVLLAVSSYLNLAITLRYGYPPAPLLTTKLQIVQVLDEYWRVLYVKPYIRCGPYIIGALTAFYLLEERRRRRDSKTSQLRLTTPLWLTIWALTLALGAYSTFGLYHYTKTGEISVWYAALYTLAGRPAFALFLALITFLCETGNGGALNSILTHKVFIPLSKLTFCAYLLHPILLQLYYLSRPTAFHFTHSFQLLNMFFAAVFSSYFVALLFSLSFEMPVMHLDKLLFGGRGNGGSRAEGGSNRTGSVETNHDSPSTERGKHYKHGKNIRRKSGEAAAASGKGILRSGENGGATEKIQLSALPKGK